MRRPVVLLTSWVLLLVLAVVVGVLYRNGKPIEVGAVPWVGRWGFSVHLLPRLLLVAGALAAAVWHAPRIAATVPLTRVIALAAVTTAALTWLLAWAGPDDTHWISLRFGYGAHTHLVDDWHGPASFLRRYVERQPFLTAHLRAHPPGLVLVLWAFEQIGLASRGFHLVLMLTGGAVSTVAGLKALQCVASESVVRGAAPFVAIGPVLVWRTNPDVIFSAVGLVAVWVLVAAITRPRSARSDRWAVAGGVAFGITLFLSYGLVLLALPVLAVAAQRRAFRPVVLAALACAMTLAIPALLGFSWLAGLFETRVQYAESIARIRGYRYWLLGNAAVYAALLGPATVVGLARLRHPVVRAVVFGGLSCAVVAGGSGLSSAETERIWQPFVPLVLLAGTALWVERNCFDIDSARRWLALQSVVAIVFQSFLWTRV